MVGYVRVSTGEQATSGLGLEHQRQAIAEAARLRDVELVEIFEDAGLSGSSLDRPGLTAALETLTTGAADGLIVAKLDRLSRSLLDFAGLMDRSRREGWSLVALDLGVDTSSPQGELMASVLATFAQFERRLIGERTKAALQVKRAQGVQLGRPRSIPDDIVALLRRYRDDGMSFQEIADRLNADGVPTGRSGKWWPATVQQVLRSRTDDPSSSSSPSSKGTPGNRT
jgi:DNA invertase Pin-like site-specific DNA recombinase